MDAPAGGRRGAGPGGRRIWRPGLRAAGRCPTGTALHPADRGGGATGEERQLGHPPPGRPRSPAPSRRWPSPPPSCCCARWRCRPNARAAAPLAAARAGHERRCPPRRWNAWTASRWGRAGRRAAPAWARARPRRWCAAAPTAACGQVALALQAPLPRVGLTSPLAELARWTALPGWKEIEVSQPPTAPGRPAGRWTRRCRSSTSTPTGGARRGPVPRRRSSGRLARGR